MKKERALASGLAGELASELGKVASTVDQHLAGGPLQRTWAKQRRKELRQLIAKAADAGQPLEERVRLLQRALVSEVEGHIAAEHRVLEVEEQAQAAAKNADASVRSAEAVAAKNAHLCTKMDKLCRELQAQLKASTDAQNAWELRCQQSEARFESFREALQSLQQSVDESAQAREAVMQENIALRKANQLLEEKAAALLSYQDQDKDRLAALEDLKDKIEAQAKAHEGLQEMRELMEKQARDQQLLAGHLEVREREVEELRDALSKAKQVIDLQDQTYKSKAADFSKQAAEFTKAVKNAQKMIGELSKSQEAFSARNRQLAEQLDGKQREAAALGGDLSRAVAQKEALEGLCRALRAQLQAAKADAQGGGRASEAPSCGTDGRASGEEAPAAAAQAPAEQGGSNEAGSPDAFASSDDTSAGPEVGPEDGATGIGCSAGDEGHATAAAAAAAAPAVAVAVAVAAAETPQLVTDAAAGTTESIG